MRNYLQEVQKGDGFFLGHELINFIQNEILATFAEEGGTVETADTNFSAGEVEGANFLAKSDPFFEELKNSSGIVLNENDGLTFCVWESWNRLFDVLVEEWKISRESGEEKIVIQSEKISLKKPAENSTPENPAPENAEYADF